MRGHGPYTSASLLTLRAREGSEEGTKPVLGLKGDRSWARGGRQCSRQRVQRTRAGDHSALGELTPEAQWSVGGGSVSGSCCSLSCPVAAKPFTLWCVNFSGPQFAHLYSEGTGP